MNNAKSIVHGSFYEFLSEAKRHGQYETFQQLPKTNIKSTYSTSKANAASSFDNNSYQRIAPIIPKNFNFHIKAADFSAVQKNSLNDFTAKIQLFSVSIINYNDAEKHYREVIVYSFVDNRKIKSENLA